MSSTSGRRAFEVSYNNARAAVSCHLPLTVLLTTFSVTFHAASLPSRRQPSTFLSKQSFPLGVSALGILHHPSASCATGPASPVSRPVLSELNTPPSPSLTHLGPVLTVTPGDPCPEGAPALAQTWARL